MEVKRRRRILVADIVFGKMETKKNSLGNEEEEELCINQWLGQSGTWDRSELTDDLRVMTLDSGEIQGIEPMSELTWVSRKPLI